MPVDPSAIATWANLVTVARMFVAPTRRPSRATSADDAVQERRA